MTTFFFLLILFTIPLIFSWGIRCYEEDLETWNNLTPTPLENVTGEGYYRIFGRINSLSEVVIFRESEGEENGRVVKQDFNITQTTEQQQHHTLFVNISDDTTIYQFAEIEGKKSPHYQDGDLVYVIGHVNVTNGSMEMVAEYVMDREIDPTEELAEIHAMQIFMTVALSLTILATFLQLGLPPLRYRMQEHNPEEQKKMILRTPNEKDAVNEDDTTNEENASRSPSSVTATTPHFLNEDTR